MTGEPEPPARTVPKPALRARKRFSLSQLPWGVIGVLVVIAALGIGAVVLLREGNMGAPAAGTSVPFTPVVDTPASASAPGATVPGATAPGASTDTPTPQAVSAATLAPTAARPTAALPVEVEVKPGDTCGGIANRYGVPLDDLIRYNKLDVSCLIKVGAKLLIPPATPTPGPSPTLAPGVTPEPTSVPEATATLPPQIIYQVRSGDTCGEIATRFRMPLDTLIQQNNLDTGCLLQIGQVLTLTFATPAPTAPPTPIVAQTPTPRAGYSAPQLTSPLDGAQISQTQTTVTLQWLSAGLLKDNEWYVVQVQPSGAVTVPLFETKGTSIKLTQDVLGDQAAREITWWVQIKQFVASDPKTGARVYNDLSAPSATRWFAWRKSPGTPTPVSP